MDISWQRIAEHLVDRVSGPMHFRIILQPAMATFFGIRDGLRDARQGKPAYFWAMFVNSGGRGELIRSGFRAVAKILILAIVLDAIYQYIELKWFYPGEAIIVALLLAFVPYLLIRGPTNRIAKWWAERRALPHPKYGTSR